MSVVHKTSADWRVTPNLVDYRTTVADLDWSVVPDVCQGMGRGWCNIAHAAVDRHAHGPTAARTTLLFVSTVEADGGPATHVVTLVHNVRTPAGRTAGHAPCRSTVGGAALRVSGQGTWSPWIDDCRG